MEEVVAVKWEDFRPGDMLVYWSSDNEENEKEAVLVLSVVPDPDGNIAMRVLVMWSQQTSSAEARCGIVAWDHLKAQVDVTWWTVVGRSDH